MFGIDEAGMETIKHLDAVTIPRLVSAVTDLALKIDKLMDENVKNVFDEAHGLLDRINGTKLTIPERSIDTASTPAVK
jgi:hypothetical protein